MVNTLKWIGAMFDIFWILYVQSGWEKSESPAEKKNIISQSLAFFFFFFLNGATQMWCNLSQSKCCHAVIGAMKPNQRRGNLHLCWHPSMHHCSFSSCNREFKGYYEALPCIVLSRESRQPQREREIKLQDLRGPMKESRVCNSIRLYPWVCFLWSQRPSQISVEIGSI